MVNFDIKYRKILYELDSDSRQSIQTIGRKVRLHKNVVLHRIRNLENQGIIKNYFTVIDSSKLGYNSYRINLLFQNVNQKIISNIIDHFVNYNNTWWAVSLKGKYDFSAAIWVKNIKEFENIWEETLRKYHDYIRDQIVSLYLQLFTLRHSYLLFDKFQKTDRTKYEIAGGGILVDIDEIDYKILKLLANNSRIPTITISKKLNISTPTVRKKIKKLIKLEIIKGFRINIDYSKLGYKLLKIDMYLNDYKKRNDIINYIIPNPNVVYISKTVGYADLEFDLIVKDEYQMYNTVEEIKKQFPDLVKYYQFIHEHTIHKLDFMPYTL